LGFRVSGVFGFWGLEFEVRGSGFGVRDSGFGIRDSGFRVAYLYEVGPRQEVHGEGGERVFEIRGVRESVPSPIYSGRVGGFGHQGLGLTVWG